MTSPADYRTGCREMYEAMGDYLQALYDDDDEQARVIGPRVGVAYRKIRAALSSNDGSRTL